MAKLEATAGQEFELIPENEIINARVGNISINSFTWDGEAVEKLKWEFIVDEPGPFKGKTVFGDTSTVFSAHPNCKAYNWTTAITGKAYEAGEVFDTDDLIGLSCRVMIGHRKDKQARTWMKVREVLPPRAGAQEAPF